MRPILLARINADVRRDIHGHLAQWAFDLDTSCRLGATDAAALFAWWWFENAKADFWWE